MAPPNMTGSPLSAQSLVTFMAASLPRDSSPPLRNAYDVIALAAHACMIAVGFRLVGLGDDHKITASGGALDPQPLPSQWNETSSHAFRYAHSQSSMEFLVKLNSLGSKAIVFGLAVGDDRTAQFEIKVDDYISKTNLHSAQISSETPTEELQKTLQDIFISVGRLGDFGALFKLSIIQKLAPGLDKVGYEEEQTPREVDDPEASTGRRQQPRRDPPRAPELPDPARPHPFHDPLAGPPNQGNRPLPEPIPGFDDELDMNRPLRRPGGVPEGGRHPFAYGEQDLYPPGMAPHDPLRIGGPLGGIRQPGQGGMHPTFDDPLFGGYGGGGGGLGGFHPHAPPGARYDPTGPGDRLRDDRMGGGGGGRRFPGGPPNPFGGFGGNDFI